MHEEVIKTLDGIKADLTQEVRAQQEHIERTGKQSEELARTITELNTRYDEMAGSITTMQETIDKIDGRMGRNVEHGTQSAAQQFAEAVRAWDGRTSTGDMPRIEVERRDLFNAPSLGSYPLHLQEHDRKGIIVPPFPDMHIRDLLPVQSTDSANIDYIRYTGGFLIADYQDETIDSVSGSQGVKKEQQVSFAADTESAKTIAHWIPITKQASRDAQAAIRIIETQLTRGLLLKEDIELLYGAGSGDIQGLMTDVSVPEFDQVGTNLTVADALRHAVTLLRSAYYRPTGVILNPVDWEGIEVAKDNEGRYLFFFGPDGIDGTQRIWRVPVIDTPAMQAGEYLMGDFTSGAVLYDYERPTLEYGWINDQFVRNQLSLLAEERIIFTVERPDAFIRGEIDTLSS